MKKVLFAVLSLCALAACTGQKTGGGDASLTINDKGYFEQPGVNVLVYSNMYQGIFCDEKTAGIELIQRGVRINSSRSIGYIVKRSTLPTGKECFSRFTATPSKLPAAMI